MRFRIPDKDADALAAMIVLPPDVVREFLAQLGAECGADRVIRLAVRMAELARALDEQMMPAVCHGMRNASKKARSIAARLNLPSMIGAVAGERVAIEPVAGMCAGCAFRSGSPANQSIVTVTAAVDCLMRREPFYCHEGIAVEEGEEPVKPCRGYLAAVAAGRT